MTLTAKNNYFRKAKAPWPVKSARKHACDLLYRVSPRHVLDEAGFRCLLRISSGLEGLFFLSTCEGSADKFLPRT